MVLLEFEFERKLVYLIESSRGLLIFRRINFYLLLISVLSSNADFSLKFLKVLEQHHDRYSHFFFEIFIEF